MVAALEKSAGSEASEESEDFEASDAYEESVQKGRETTELLTVCLCMDKPTNLLWRYVFMLRCNVTGHFGLELGPQAKGSQGGPCKSSEKPRLPRAPVGNPEVPRPAAAWQAAMNDLSHGVRKPWEVHVMAYHLQRHKLCQQACKS